MSVTSPAGGAAPTDGYGAAWAGLNMWHKTNAAASTVTTRFFFSVDTAVASFTGAGTSARLAVFGSTSCGVCTPADAYQLVIAVSDGITTTTPQPTYEVDVTMSSPSGSIPRGTMIGYSAALEAVVGADAAPWSGAGATCGAVRLTRVTFSA